MGNVDILTTTARVVTAPAPVWLEARNPTGFNVSEPSLDVYDETFHDITYIWTVRGAPLPNYSRVQNMVSEWNNANVAYGKKVAFRFPTAGTYNIDLWCVDSVENSAIATTQVVVVEPTFTPANTIVYSESGFSGAPAGTQVSDMTTLNFALQGRSNPTRLAFKPGETVRNTSIRPETGNLAYVDTWTKGSKVTLQTDFIDFFTRSGFWFDDTSPLSQITIRDVIYSAGWDPTTETGDGGGATGNFAWIPQRVDVMLYNCDMSGLNNFDITLRDYGGVTGCRIMVADCVVTNWRGYGLTHFPNEDSRSWHALLGNRITQNPLALGGGFKTDMQNDHGCIRIANAEHIYMVCNDMFTTSGWSGNPPPANAAVRLHTSVYADSSTVFERNVIEGGYTQIKIDGQNEIQAEYSGNHLIERNLCIGTARTFLFWNADYGGTTFRNNLCYMPNVPIFDGGIYEFYNIGPDAPDASNNQPLEMYCNSFVSRETAGNRPLTIGSASYWNTFTSENNIHYNPGTPGGVPLDFSTKFSGIKPRYSQVRFNFQMYNNNLGVNVPNGQTVSLPYTELDRSVGFAHGTLVTGSTAVTDQAYWQAAEAAGDSLHMMRVHTADYGHANLFASRGDFAVSYADSANIVITNTSGTTWNTGEWNVRLDRRFYLERDLPPATIYANPSSIPTCAPLTSPGPGDTLGKLAYDDMFTTIRTQPVSSGAIET